MQSMCVSGLTELDAKGVAQPELAESWDVSSDGLKYTFHLADAKWSNGDAVTAADFVYGWQRLDDPKTASEYAFILDTIHVKNAADVNAGTMDKSQLGVKAVDDKTFEVDLTLPCDFLLGLMAFPSFFPLNQKFYEKEGDQFALSANDMAFWFGTDTQGRDLFTRVWEGTRISLIIALTAVLIDVFIGMSYGLISGYFGGKVDMVMQRIAEILNGIPTLVVVTLLGLVLPSGIISIIFALMITGWIGMSRIARAEVLKLKESEYILASRTLGAKNFAIIFKEIMPNIFGQIIVMSMFSIPNAIFTEAFLSFVGLGIQPPMASLGSLISEGYKSFTVYPYMIAAPIIVLALLMLSFNLFADGIRDAFDPNQKQR